MKKTTAERLNDTITRITVSIKNVTLSASGVWRLQYVGLQQNDVLMSCYMHVYSFLCVVATNVICTEAASCSPTEEHQSTTLTYLWLTSYNQWPDVSWFKDSIVLSKCNSTPKCVDYIPNFSRTTAEMLNDTMTRITVSIKNVTLSASGVWRLQYVGLQQNDVLMSCYLHVYSKGTDVNCSHKVYSGSFIIRCSAQRIYPKALCKAIVQNNGKMCTNSKIKDVTNEEMIKGLRYYNSTCIVEVNYQVDRKWRFDVLVFIYPNVTGDENDVQYGISETVPVEIDKPTETTNLCLDKTCECDSVQTHFGDDVEEESQTTNVVRTTRNYEHEVLHNGISSDRLKGSILGESLAP
ncbi:hypothetical protein Btru_069094 [Bulinus truncatus]|nr:hypothetical protein Btru_069094 [Bulinus truncatus]